MKLVTLTQRPTQELHNGTKQLRVSKVGAGNGRKPLYNNTKNLQSCRSMYNPATKNIKRTQNIRWRTLRAINRLSKVQSSDGKRPKPVK
jgi:hypothetical protein